MKKSQKNINSTCGSPNLKRNFAFEIKSSHSAKKSDGKSDGLKAQSHSAEVVGHKGEQWLYTDTVKEHFFHPKNIFITEEEAKKYEKTADGVGQVGSPSCGDVMRMFIKVDKKNNTIKECKWRTFGCASAIASTSMLSTMVIGMTLEECKNITPQDIVKALGGLPARKIHCSVLGDQALRAAIEDYERKRKK